MNWSLHKYVWISLALLSLINVIIAQDNLPLQYKFHKLNETQNLSNNVINSIEQDTLGFIWVGTEDGLFRFNGTNFNTYRRKVGSGGLPNNTINKVYIDRSNRVWALTNYGLGIYDYSGDSITGFEPAELGISVKSLNAIVEDADGNLYIGTAGEGIIKFSNKFENLHTESTSKIDLSSLEVSCMAIHNNDIWIGTWQNGIIHYDLESENPSLIKLLSENEEQPYIYDIHVDKNGLIWIGTTQGFQLIDEDHLVSKPIENIDDEVLAIKCAQNDDLWFGTRASGLFLKKKNEPGFNRFEPGEDEFAISHRTVSEIFMDRTNKLWLGTHNQGINVFDPKGEKITFIRPQDKVGFKINNSSVWGLGISSKDNIWVGTDGSGLLQFDPKTQKIDLVASIEKGIKISDDAILSVTEINADNILLGTYSGGLNLVNLKSRTSKIINQSDGLLSNDIRVSFVDSNERLWIGTNRGGLYQLNISKGEVELIEGTAHLDIRGITHLPNNPNTLWLATYGNGLVKYEIESRTLSEFTWESLDSDFIPIALSITYSKGKLWIGTKESGLLSFNLGTNEFELFNENKGLLNNTIRAIIPYKDHLWLSSNMGITAFHIETKQIQNFDGKNGISMGQFNDGSAILFRNKYLAFGGINGLILFEAEQLLNENELPKVTFTKLELDNNPIHPSNEHDHLSKSISVADEVRFGPDEYVFTIHYNVLNLANTGSWHYEYRLKNFDKSWNHGSNLSEATYRNIPPGSYSFQVRVVDASNSSKGPISQINLLISPPWWKTIYAFIAFSLSILILIYILYKYNTDRAKMRQSLQFEQRLRQKEHDNMQEKVLFYTNFSHEMRTPITLISGPVNDLLRNENISLANKKSLRLIKRNANTLLKLINRLLEFRKLETKNTVLNVGYHDLTVLAQEEAESFSYLAKDQDIKFGFYCETDLNAWIDIEKFQIIINNLLSNALKYAEKETKVTFKVQHQAPKMIIEVKDEGRGIEKDELEKIFVPFYQAKNSIGTGGTGIGLSLCKNFIELHGGSIAVESKLQEGSKFIVTFPDDNSLLKGQDYVRFIEVQKGEIVDETEIETSENVIEEVIENEKILLVAEDNADIRNYLATLFESSFKVIKAKDGEAALELAKETVPNIIISDIMMPKIDGLTFCKEIKSNVATSHIPVILLTAKGTNQTKVDGYEVGADGYITKPFDSNVLIARVNNLLESRERLKVLHESDQWMENKDVPSSEVEFVLNVESVVLEMIPKGELNVIQLCRELGFSRTSLYRKIKSLTGQSIKQFIRSIKLKKAAEMLATEDMAVSEVAFSLDFTDLKYFRTCFKKQYGKLPSEYQNEMKSNQPIDQDEIKKALKI
ncbi:hybrid sensor histidine kinase/response regulator [Ekhidna sp.]